VRPAEGDPAGQVLPPTLVEPLLAVVAEALPPPLTVDAVGATPIVWGDPGLTAAADRGDRIVLHVGLWHHLAPRGMAAVALAIAEALVPIARDPRDRGAGAGRRRVASGATGDTTADGGKTLG
jgi:hypothetical protein